MPDDFTHQGESADAQWVMQDGNQWPYKGQIVIQKSSFVDQNIAG
jgi:hypothetical protein